MIDKRKWCMKKHYSMTDRNEMTPSINWTILVLSITFSTPKSREVSRMSYFRQGPTIRYIGDQKNSLVSRFDIQYDNNFQISHITNEEKPTATISGQSKHYEKVNAR